MKNYVVVYKEILSHTFYVEANDENEAKEKFKEAQESGDFDYSYGKIVDTTTEAYEAEE